MEDTDTEANRCVCCLKAYASVGDYCGICFPNFTPMERIGICPNDGKKFYRHNIRKIFCSLKCRKEVHDEIKKKKNETHICTVCKDKYAIHGGMCGKCWEKHVMENKRVREPKYCLNDNKFIRGMRKGALFCSSECAQEHWRKQHRHK